MSGQRTSSSGRKAFPGCLVFAIGAFLLLWAAVFIGILVIFIWGASVASSYGPSTEEVVVEKVVAVEPHDFAMDGESIHGYIIRTQGETFMAVPLISYKKYDPVEIIRGIQPGLEYRFTVCGNPPEGLPVYRALVSAEVVD